MANPTVAELILRVRELAREQTADFWTDVDKSMLGFVTAGLEAQHAAVLTRLLASGQQKPSPASPYWRQFHATKAIAFSASTVEYVLPSVENERFDIFDSLIDAATAQPFYPYQLKYERELAQALTRFGDEPNYYCFVPGSKLRFLVAPGSRGVPQEARNVTLRYFRGIQHHTLTSETVDLRAEFCEGPCWYALAKAYQSKQISHAEPMGEFRAAVERIV